MDRQAGRQADRWTGRQADRWAGRQAGRRAGRRRPGRQAVSGGCGVLHAVRGGGERGEGRDGGVPAGG